MQTLFSDLEYCSLLSYATHPETSAQLESCDVMRLLKQNKRLASSRQTISELVAERASQRLEPHVLAKFFGPEVLAVPIPSSSLKRPGSLWVPMALSQALKRVGLVGEVLSLVERTKALPKSATSPAKARSKVADHFDSIQVSRTLIGPSSILLVDDVITRGATMMGVAGRIREAYPDVPIHGFAAMRAISNAVEFSAILAPVSGKIIMLGAQTKRQP